MLFGQDFFFRFSSTMEEVESAPFRMFGFRAPTLPSGLVCITDIDTLKIRQLPNSIFLTMAMYWFQWKVAFTSRTSSCYLFASLPSESILSSAAQLFRLSWVFSPPSFTEKSSAAEDPEGNAEAEHEIASRGKVFEILIFSWCIRFVILNYFVSQNYKLLDTWKANWSLSYIFFSTMIDWWGPSLPISGSQSTIVHIIFQARYGRWRFILL